MSCVILLREPSAANYTTGNTLLNILQQNYYRQICNKTHNFSSVYFVYDHPTQEKRQSTCHQRDQSAEEKVKRNPVQSNTQIYGMFQSGGMYEVEPEWPKMETCPYGRK